MLRRQLFLALSLVPTLLACGDSKAKSKKKSDDDDEDDKKKKKKKKKESEDDDDDGSKKKEPVKEKEPEKPKSSLPDKYKTFKSDVGKYEIMMPGVPAVTTSASENGAAVNQALVDGGDTAYIVAVADFPAGSPLSLDGTRDGIKKGIDNATHKSVKILGKYDGYEVKGTKVANGKPVSLISVVFIKARRLYTMVSVGIPDAEAAAWAASFKLTDES